VNRSTRHNERAGLLFGVAAYGLWGLMPLYFRAVRDVAPLELLAHRVVWSVAFMAGLLTLLGRWPAVRTCLADRQTRWLLAASTVLIAANWFVFIYGVSTGQVVQNSLGYFINPLLNIVLGVLLFRERLRPAQWLGLGLATGGLVYLVVARGEVPWLALFLATSFAGYGVLRKVAPVDA
jgi:chloramphenicol-sensitive protein RarD